MPAWSLTVNLGSNEEGQARREAYERSAKKEQMSLSEWVKSILDTAAKIKIVRE